MELAQSLADPAKANAVAAGLNLHSFSRDTPRPLSIISTEIPARIFAVPADGLTQAEFCSHRGRLGRLFMAGRYTMILARRRLISSRLQGATCLDVFRACFVAGQPRHQGVPALSAAFRLQGQNPRPSPSKLVRWSGVRAGNACLRPPAMR